MTNQFTEITRMCDSKNTEHHDSDANEVDMILVWSMIQAWVFTSPPILSLPSRLL